MGFVMKQGVYGGINYGMGTFTSKQYFSKDVHISEGYEARHYTVTKNHKLKAPLKINRHIQMLSS